MKRILLIILYYIAVAGIFYVSGQSRHIVVVDSLTRSPLSHASIFNNNGKFIGTSRTNGRITCAKSSDFPLTIRYVGYYERTVPNACIDTISLVENFAELPEVVVEAKQNKFLHILAYVREYSTLTSYSDTITMFREKMVDFMLPTNARDRFRGWRYPRVLNSQSYYHFTNSDGLDSVSDACNHHFTWSDWIGMVPTRKIPDNIANKKIVIDTVFGKYGPTEIWNKDGSRLTLDINVMADTMSRKWVPNITYFLENENTDFEQLRLKLNYDNVISNEIGPLDLTGYSFNIESRGRGRGLFKFNRHDEPFYVNTYAEVYVIDKEFISSKEAKKWESHKFSSDEIEIFEPQEAPDLDTATLTLIERVNSINQENVRLSIMPDERLISRNVMKGNFGIGHRALSLLKQLTGITYYRSHKNFRNRWNKFRDDRQQSNKKRTE